MINKKYDIMERHYFNISLLVFTALSLFSFLISCSSFKRDKSVRIAISKSVSNKNYGAYGKWLKVADSTVECVDMYHINRDLALELLKNCSALLLTGGPDVFPGTYGKIDDTSRCGKFDLKRDTLEFALIKEAVKRKMPIIGICRGEQILNVAMGGSLIIDIPTDYGTLVKHRCKNSNNCFHKVQIVHNSLLNKICKVNSGVVNSNHHQAVDRLAYCFKVMARANDSLIESFGWKNPENKSFLLAVQWHPERLNAANSLSFPIAKQFIREAKKYSRIIK